jgi:hypothetical protein
MTENERQLAGLANPHGAAFKILEHFPRKSYQNIRIVNVALHS